MVRCLASTTTTDPSGNTQPKGNTLAPNDVKTVSVQLTAAQAQQVLRTVEKDPDSGNWGEGNKVRNEVTAAFRSALGAPVHAAEEPTPEVEQPVEPEAETPEEDEAAPGQVEDELAPDEQPNTDEPAGSEEVPASPSSEDGESESDEAYRS